MTRKYDGKAWQPEERIDRVHALKMYTRWAAEYVQKPDKLGSIEVGKFADLLVIDRDYFTISEDDILKVRPLMTMVGGKMIANQSENKYVRLPWNEVWAPCSEAKRPLRRNVS